MLDCREEYTIVLEAFSELEQSLKLDNILLQGRDRRVHTGQKIRTDLGFPVS